MDDVLTRQVADRLEQHLASAPLSTTSPQTGKDTVQWSERKQHRKTLGRTVWGAELLHEVEDVRRAVDWAHSKTYPSFPSRDAPTQGRPETFWQIVNVEMITPERESPLWKALHLTVCRQFWLATGILGTGCRSSDSLN